MTTPEIFSCAAGLQDCMLVCWRARFFPAGADYDTLLK
jgi:hypothetical protein